MKYTHYCFYCGESLGVFRDKQRQQDYDTCGNPECAREARSIQAQERFDAHERLDDEMGWR